VPLIEQSTWWIAPAFALGLFMVFAMMEHMASLLERRPRAGSTSVDAAELRRRLLNLNDTGKPYRVIEGKVSDLEIDWDVVDDSWKTRFAKVKLSTVYHARMLLDETRHEVRWFEAIRTSNLFLGFDGWIPRFNVSIWAQAGYIDVMWSGVAYGIQPGFPPRIGGTQGYSLNTVEIKHAISGVINRSGWIFRPTILWFQTKRGSFRVGQALLPSALTHWPARRFWGVVYPASYVATVAWIFWVTGGARDPKNLLALAAFSAFWWGIWGFITVIFMITSGKWKPGGRSGGHADRGR
jgi:hypothetical protein